MFAGGGVFGDSDSLHVRADLAQRWGTAPLVPQNGSFMQGPGGRDTAYSSKQALTCPSLPRANSAIKSASEAGRGVAGRGC